MGDRSLYLQEAKLQIEEKAGKIHDTSAIYETAAWGIEAQPSFLNQVLVLYTTLSPHDLMSTLLSIEHALGRIREKKMGPRFIDIDILFYDDLIIKTDTLTIPHPLLHLRRFTLQPLAEINPQKIHPVLKQTAEQLLLNCPDTLKADKLDGLIHNL